jgi:hypothetical protein
MVFDAMFLNSDGFNLGFLLLAIAAIGTIVGTLWLRRIAGPDPDKEPSFWRYRQVDQVRRPSKVNWLPTPGWIATRLTMVVSVGVFAFVLLAPVLLWPNRGAVADAPLIWIVAVALAAVGTRWIFGIARADPESERRSWRYRA